jgi:hypothetical protein
MQSQDILAPSAVSRGDFFTSRSRRLYGWRNERSRLMNSTMPCSYDATADTRRLKLRTALEERGKRHVAYNQAHAWLLLHMAVATDTALQAELEQARGHQAPITRCKDLIVKAVTEGAITAAEAITLWKRAV